MLTAPPPGLKRTFLGQLEGEHARALRVLLIEDNEAVRDACSVIVSSFGLMTEVAGSLAEARRALHAGCVDIVLLDLNLRDECGLKLVEEIKRIHPRASIILMTAYATVSSAVEGLRNGVSDYIEKPFTVEELRAVLERAACRPMFDVEARRLDEDLHKGRAKGILTARSPMMSKVRRIIARVAFIQHPILILGESGTGKEYVARSIHASGPGVSDPFRKVDCGSSLNLVERGLFGDMTNACWAKNEDMGLPRSPSSGTLFLKDIDALPLDLQDRLLAVLSDGRFPTNDPTASLSPLCLRILAGTSRELSAMVETREFRKELFNRLNMINIRIPPLRERREDIPVIVASVLNAVRHESGHAYRLADDAMTLLMEHDWPGNVRELERSLRYACALSSGLLLHAGDFPIVDRGENEQKVQDNTLQTGERCAFCRGDSQSQPSTTLSIAEMERNAIITTLRQVKGDKLHAAKLLGIGKTTLYRKLGEYRISDPEGVKNLFP